MAHIAKYKAASCGHMLAHYRRDRGSLGRENIDPGRTKDNYTLGLDERDGKVRALKGIEPNWETVEGRIEKVNEAAKAAGMRATRKDAVVMADVVVTLPENVRKGDEGKFFGYTYWFLINKLGEENMMGGFVHLDEVRKDGSPVRDHMHAPFTPILDGRFNYKKMIPRSFYKTMHKELGDYLEQRLGYRPEIELGEGKKAEKVLSRVPTEDLDTARAAIIEPAQDEAARIVAAAREEAAALLSDATMRKAELVAEIAGKEGDLAELDNELSDVQVQVDEENDRLECLRQETADAARDVDELESIAADVRRFDAAGRRDKGTIVDSICARCDGLARRCRAALEGIERAIERIGRAMRPQAPTFDELARGARLAADAWNRDHAAPPTSSRSRWQSR